MYLYPLTYGDATIEVNGIKKKKKRKKKEKLLSQSFIGGLKRLDLTAKSFELKLSLVE